MSERAELLARDYNAEVVRLLTLLTLARPGELLRPCPGWEKLADGTVGTVAAHTVDNFGQVGRFAVDPTVFATEPLPADRLRTVAPLIARITDLDDSRLDSVPAAGSFRFCDGERTLERVLSGILTHLGHQIDAVAAGLGD